MKSWAKFILSLVLLESAFAIHEYGHLREFQKRGIQIEEFSLGIGPALYQYKTASLYQVSFRLIPVMAYVQPTKEGAEFFKNHTSIWDNVVVHSAGVRNNVLSALLVIFFFQVLGWKRGNITLKELVSEALLGPVKFMLRFIAFLLEGLSQHRIKLGDQFLLSTGGINPPEKVREFIVLSLILAIFNFLPILPWDGGHAFETIMPPMPIYLSLGISMVFCFLLIGSSNQRVLQIELAEAKAEERGHEEQINDEYIGSPLKGTALSKRVTNLLWEAGYRKIGDLRGVTADELLAIPGFGPKSLEKVEKYLGAEGITLRRAP